MFTTLSQGLTSASSWSHDACDTCDNSGIGRESLDAGKENKMSDAPDSAVGGGNGVDEMNSERDSPTSSDLTTTESTILMEMADDVVVLFGEVPEGVELVDLDLIPEYDRTQLSRALGSIGNAGTIAGNIAETATRAQGLFRLNEATFSLLRSGGELAAKDGAKLGAILKNGQVIAQARFIPVSMTATTTIAAIGPAVAMIALQMQLGEISSLVRTSIALTTQTLKAIRNEQWSELESLADSIDDASQKVREIGAITDTLWESIAPMGQSIRKQMGLYWKNVTGHIQEIRKSDGNTRRQYLESNAEAIVFDTYALLTSLKTHATYQALMATQARKRSETDKKESNLFEKITRDTPSEIKESLEEIGQLTESLVRELRIIAELPGRATMPLTKKRRDAKAAKLTCAQLLEAIEPLADALHPAVDTPAVPETVCAPDGLDLDPYLHVLRWFLEDGEQLHGIAFPYEASAHNFSEKLPAAALSKLVDAGWQAGKVAFSTFIAVTDRRIITANPKKLLRHGELGATYPLDDVKDVHLKTDNTDHVCPLIGVTTKQSDIRWMFPARADQTSIEDLATTMDDLASVITEGASGHAETRAAIASSATETASS